MGKVSKVQSPKSKVGHAALLILCLLALPAQAGSIRAAIESEQPIQSAWVMRRWQTTRSGVLPQRYEATLANGQLTVEGLPLDMAGEISTFDLWFQTPSGTVAGWDAQVPASDYEQEQPLSPEGRRAILDKLAEQYRRHWPDEVQVLDIQGNIQNVSILLTQLRTRPGVFGDGTETPPGTWAYRVDRWQYQDPEEHTWAPDSRFPFYATIRQRVGDSDYKSIHLTYARHLGGFRFRAGSSDLDLGTLKVPAPKPGISAVDPECKPIRPIPIKPKPEIWPED